MCALLGDTQTSRRLIRESLVLLDGPTLADEDTRLERAHIALELGYTQLYAHPEAARQRFAESLELHQEIGHKWGMAYALLGLGRAARNLGALGEAREAMTQSLSLHRDIGNQIGQSEAMAALGGVAIRQLRFQEAEDLIRQSLSLTPESNRFGIAYGLGFLGDVQLLTGRFAEVEATISDCIAIFEDLGWRVLAARRSIVLARARLHVGEYGAARIQAEGIVSQAQEVGWSRGVSYGKLVLGEVALVEVAYAQAYQILQESLLGFEQLSDDPGYFDQSAWLGLAARGLERRSEAWQQFTSALDWAIKGQQFNELMVALTGIALLLADEGEAERAIELYALASRYPFVSNSHWFEDVVGRHIAATAATLPPQVAAAARERGRGRELEATVGELSAELGRHVPAVHS
jgi:tetratricopeptide (TPR) repeat protein